eukprot:15334125-Ditylum_brightwellii.AAC.1
MVPAVLVQWVNYNVPTWEPLFLANLNIYDNKAGSVLLSALGGVESDNSAGFDSETEGGPPTLTHQIRSLFFFSNGSCASFSVEDTSCCLNKETSSHY